MTRPELSLVAAISLDGRLATRRRASGPLASPEDLAHLLALRCQHDAIIIGAGTLRADNPLLLPSREHRKRRRTAGLQEAPWRIILSRSLDFDPGARGLRPDQSSPIVVLCSETAPESRRAACRAKGMTLQIHKDADVDLPAALDVLAAEGIRHIQCEGGSQTNAAFLAAGLVDALWLTLCPQILADPKAPSLVAPCLAYPSPAFRLVEQRRHESELYLHYRRLP